MPMETRSSSALFKRAEQLRRWQESETNQESTEVSSDKPRRIKFSDGCVFLAACAAGDKEEVERLLEQGADINTANVDGLTALHQACIDDNLDMVEFLVEHNCDLNRGDNEGWSPLHATASCGFVSIARYLIELGANVASVNNDGDLPIDIGESGEIEDLLKAEINRLGIDCDQVRAQEERQMMEDANQWLNARCMTEQIHPKTGATALHVAAAKGYVKVMALLIQAGADLNGQDYDGWTPLHAASHWGQKEACQILAENLANMDIRNFSGQTCFDVGDPEMIKLLDELKNKQASMQLERPEIQAILQRPPMKVPPPLKRRTSVTRMSGADKSSQVMKDTILERAQIEANLRLEEEEEDAGERRVTPAPAAVPVAALQPETVAAPKEEDRNLVLKNDVNVVDRIAEEPSPVVQTKEATEENQVGIPAVKKEASPEDDRASWRKTRPIPDESKPVVEAPVAAETITSSVENVPAPEKPTEEINNVLPAPTRIRLKTDRVFLPPVRDEESEAQRKAHAKRVRETRRSTQGVTLEDLKSAEQQLLRKQQEEDERKERERDSDLAKKVPEVKPAVATAATPVTTVTSRISATPTNETFKAKAGSPPVTEKRISWRSRSEESSKPKDEVKVKEETRELKTKEDPKVTKEEPVVLRRPTESNHILLTGGVQEQVTKPNVTSASVTTTTTTTATTPLRTRQRPVSAPADSAADTKAVPSSNLPFRIRVKSDQQAPPEGGGNEEQELDEDNKAGSQAAIQRRRRPKRRSTGVVLVDAEGNVSLKQDSAAEEAQQPNEKEEDKPSGGATDRYRSRYGSSNSLQDGTSRLSDRSLTASPVSSTTSLNEDAEKDYKKLYFEMKDENDRLKKKLSKSESELDTLRQDLQRAQRNMRNSLNDGDRRERRALERKVSELEEELKEFEKIQSDNLRLREENGALIRVISKLSK